MNEFFKKFFRNPKKDKNDNSPGNAKLLSLIYDYIKDKNAPDNTKLLKLINDYTKDYKYENYIKIIAELKEGDADLLLPVYNKTSTHISGWTPAPEGYSIKSGIYFVNEITTVAAFTSKETLFAWAQKPAPYIELLSKTVIEMCEANEIKQIIIDSKLPIMITFKNDE